MKKRNCTVYDERIRKAVGILRTQCLNMFREEGILNYLLTVGLHENDSFKVKLETKEIKNMNNIIETEYKILEIVK